MKWAVLVGGTGSNLEALLRAGFSVDVVISHRRTAGAIQIAARYEVPCEVLLPRDFPDRASYDRVLREVLNRYQIDALALAGFMRWLHPETINAYEGKIVNIHPSLLPAFAGMHAIEQAFEHGVRWTGVTVHFVDAGHDTGPIIAQVPVPRLVDDTVETLEKRIHQAEHELYPHILRALDRGDVMWDGHQVQWKGDHTTWSNGRY